MNSLPRRQKVPAGPKKFPAPHAQGICRHRTRNAARIDTIKCRNGRKPAKFAAKLPATRECENAHPAAADLIRPCRRRSDDLSTEEMRAIRATAPERVEAGIILA